MEPKQKWMSKQNKTKKKKRTVVSPGPSHLCLNIVAHDNVSDAPQSSGLDIDLRKPARRVQRQYALWACAKNPLLLQLLGLALWETFFFQLLALFYWCKNKNKNKKKKKKKKKKNNNNNNNNMQERSNARKTVKMIRNLQKTGDSVYEDRRMPSRHTEAAQLAADIRQHQPASGLPTWSRKGEQWLYMRRRGSARRRGKVSGRLTEELPWPGRRNTSEISENSECMRACVRERERERERDLVVPI